MIYNCEKNVLSTVSSSEIFTQTKDQLELPQRKKVKPFFGIKSEKLFFLKRNRLHVRIENAMLCRGSAFSLQLRYKYWSETAILGLIMFQRALMLITAFLGTSAFIEV